MRRRYIPALVFMVAMATSTFAGICEDLAPTSDNATTYGVDYRPRLGFRTQSDEDVCALPLDGDYARFRLYAWNVGLGTTGASFRLLSDGEIVSFEPHSGFSDAGEGPSRPGDLYAHDVHLVGPLACGPVKLGIVTIAVPAGSDGLWVDLDGYGGDGLAVVFDVGGADLPAVSPRHGAYAGAVDLFHCQPTLCAEPLAPIDDLTPVQSGDTVIELGWTAGDGDFTMIRFRGDGVHPTSVYDGELLTVFPSFPGQWQTIVHANPEVPEYWYTAFNVRMSGGEVEHGSMLECGSFAEGSVDESISNEVLTWGSVKTRYR